MRRETFATSQDGQLGTPLMYIDGVRQPSVPPPHRHPVPPPVVHVETVRATVTPPPPPPQVGPSALPPIQVHAPRIDVTVPISVAIDLEMVAQEVRSLQNELIKLREDLERRSFGGRMRRFWQWMKGLFR